MLYFGCPQLAFLGEFEIRPMSTVIVRTYTPDGLVIGTDGLACNSYTEKIESKNEQKVFCFGGAETLAFSFTGSVQLGREGRVWFDFVQFFRLAAATIPVYDHPDLKSYANALANAMHGPLTQIRASGAICFTEAENERQQDGYFTIAQVLIDGYVKGLPGRCDILFTHRGQSLDVKIASSPLHNQPMVAGPALVTERYSYDPVFAKYRTIQDRTFHRNGVLSAEIHRTKCLIEAHGSDEARAIDPICRFIGGRTQIATITRADGFQWVPGFEAARL